MKTDWKIYQNNACGFFRSLGLDADAEVLVEGARGKHKVDVCVTFEKFGICHKWLVECKAWKQAVPKEKVLAFHSIVQDVGADKGFFLSESGFQAGAIACAQNTNIILTNIEYLKSQAERELDDLRYSKAKSKLEETMDLLRDMPWRRVYRKSNRSGGLLCHAPKGYFSVLGKLLVIEDSLRAAMKGKTPLIYDIDSDGEPKRTNDINEFLANITGPIDQAIKYYEANKDYVAK